MIMTTEFQIPDNDKFFSKYRLLKDIQTAYPNLEIVSYIYHDKRDTKFKNTIKMDTPIVPFAYINVSGNPDDILDLIHEMYETIRRKKNHY